MNLEKYLYTVSASALEYTFTSIGPHGRIKKIVRYYRERMGFFSYLSLVFGNVIEGAPEVDTLSVSNNGDRDKLLATVAATVFEVTARYPEIFVIAKGSTRARTRLYQIGVFGHFGLIAPLFVVFGLRNGRWRPARRNINYEAFAVIRKAHIKTAIYEFT